MTKVTEGARLARLAAGITVGLLMTASGYSAAIAGEVTPANTNGFQHFFDCFGAMLHDGQAHQQYCGPGDAPGPGNGSLGSFSGGAGPACIPYAMLDRSFDAVKVASLTPDFYIDAPTLSAPTFRQANHPSCCPTSSLSVPVKVNVASLTPDFYIDPAAPKGAATKQVATSCCFGSLTAPAFETYQTASLDESIGSELQTIAHHTVQLVGGC